jgi:hypothetical protein
VDVVGAERKVPVYCFFPLGGGIVDVSFDIPRIFDLPRRERRWT